MSKKSNNNGRAFEFSFINALAKAIKLHRPVLLKQDDHYSASQSAWNATESSIQDDLNKASSSVLNDVFELEPNLINGLSNLELYIQPDSQGEKGDVRDVVAKDASISWEVGFSLKHNHFAVKHSRLSRNIDFGSTWYNCACSQTYWDKIKPIFDRLQTLKNQNIEWNQVSDKIDTIYKPLLQAFMDEVSRAVCASSKVPQRMVEYLLGTYDFWKMIGIDDKQQTQLIAFNLRNELGHNSTVVIPKTSLPSSIVGICFSPKHPDNTVLLAFDEGWTFSFRIHNASTVCEPSLKFDIQIVGMPTSMFSVICNW